MNPMQQIRIEKLTLNIGTGGPGEKMEKAFGAVWKTHINTKTDLRTSAYLGALTRILKAMK